MWELERASFNRGILELELARTPRGPLWLVSKIGPLKGRLLALVLILSAGFMSYYLQPYRSLVNSGLLGTEAAKMLQGALNNLTLFLGVALYLLVFLWRQEKMLLVFDRHKQELHFEDWPAIKKMRTKRGFFPFKKIKAFIVNGPDKEPHTEHGFLEIQTDGSFSGYESIRFKFLSDEQAKIYPLNIYRISDKLPVGDWSE
jgi:hypothetical protein